MKARHFLPRSAAVAACWLLVCTTVATAADSSSPKTPQSAKAADSADQQSTPKPEKADTSSASSLLEKLELGDLGRDNAWHVWLWLLLAIFVGLVVGRIVAIILRRVATRLEAFDWLVRASVFRDLIGPAKLALLTLGLTVGLVNVTMGTHVAAFCAGTLRLLYTIAVFWYLFNLVNVIDVVLRRFTAKTDTTLDDQLVPLIRKTLRVFLVVIGILFVVDSVFQQDIGAWLAGLGIAGLAVSLAAQDSLKNLFGSITILLDRPFHVGERIVYRDYDGAVEEIGFRSTKIRTLSGHVVTIPNSNIVNDPVENIGQRKSIRRIMNVTITYDTPREKIEQAVDIIREILESEGIREPIHPVIDGDEFPPRVYFNDYNAESLKIIVIYWYAPPAYWDYLDHAQRLNLRLFEEFEKAAIEFAFPTQTVFLAGDPKRELAIKMLGRDM